MLHGTALTHQDASQTHSERQGSLDNRQKSLIDTILATIVALLTFATVWGLISHDASAVIPAVGISGLTVVAFVLIRHFVSSDHQRADQVEKTLTLANETLGYLRQGLSEESAQAVCELLLPNVDAVAVGISSTDTVLGFAGQDSQLHPQGSPAAISMEQLISPSGEPRSLLTTTDLGLADGGTSSVIKAALVNPLVVRSQPVGALKLYYRRKRDIDETQETIATGFAELLSTQLSLHELDAQTELATRMRLKALQAQINPHFLFNTINTIASLIRTDPPRARDLLREFAIFYRRILENSQDLITITQEVDQVQRYLIFEKARFGEDRIAMDVRIEPGLEGLQVPSFVIQPIVENSVGHAMRDEGTLHISVDVMRSGDDVVAKVADDGVGMTSEQAGKALQPGYGSGIGIALKNVDDRLKGYFGAESGIRIESELGVGTTVFLTFHDADV